MLQAVIFDLDGVLIDSTKYIWLSFAELLRDKVTFTEDDIRMYLASSMDQNAKSWKERFGVEINDIEAFSREAGKIEFELEKKQLKKNPDLIGLLDTLKANHIKLGVGTSSRRWRAEKILDLLGIKGYFSSLVASNDVINHKPHPEVFLTVAEKLQVDPKCCVVIEDAVNGIQAAHGGGMKVIGLVTQYHSAEELADADRVIATISELNLSVLREVLEY